MTLIERIKEDVKASMKDKNKDKTSTLRMIISEANNIAMLSNKKDPNDDDTMKALTKGIKQREDSILLYQQGNRLELAAKEVFEKDIYQSYLPEQLSMDELTKIIESAITALGVTSKKETGKVMGKIAADIKGKADMKIVSQIINDNLA